MNLKLAQEIVRTLQRGATPRDCGESLSGFRRAQWEDSLSWLRRSGLALYGWSRIRSQQAESAVPETIRKRLDDDLQENRVRLFGMAEEFRALLKLIEGANTPYVVLRGFALTPEYCPDPALRNQYDFDFLVDAGSVPRIDEVLRQAALIQKPRRSSSGTDDSFVSGF